MADRKQWIRLIRQNNANRLGRIHKNLFRDTAETVEYLYSLIEVAVSQPPGHIRSLIADVRRITRSLPAGRLDSVLDEFISTGKDNFRSLVVLSLGSYPDELETSCATIERLLEVIEPRNVTVDYSQHGNGGLFALMVLMEASARNHTHTWTNILRQMHLTGNTDLFREIAESFSMGDFTYSVVPYSQVGDSYNFLGQTGESASYRFPAPDDLVEWTGQHLGRWFETIAARDERFIQLCDELQEQMAAYSSAYEDMWLEMMLEPVWGLRDGGLDCVRVSIPALRESGLRRIRFEPREPFPGFRATFIQRRIGGSERLFEINLEPNDLAAIGRTNEPDSMFTWSDRLLAFVAVRAVWMIVMGVTGRTNSGTWTRHGGSSGSGIIRPRFRRLPDGYHASPEARTRALETFRREPQTGFTFVRQYERGSEQQSGEPLFTITDADP
ncbi:MAG: hypothetical protein PHC70_02685 [Patescibacteria group bacterium]|nr:hypothetical protein [Patescibacteria group bacterium]